MAWHFEMLYGRVDVRQEFRAGFSFDFERFDDGQQSKDIGFSWGGDNLRDKVTQMSEVSDHPVILPILAVELGQSAVGLSQ